MKKLLSVAVLFSYILFGSILNAKNITIGNDLSVPIPPNYKTFQIDAEKIYKSYNYSHSNELSWLKEIGIDKNLDILIFSTSSKSLKLYKDLANKKGLQRIIEEYWKPAEKIMEGEDFYELVLDAAKKAGIKVETMSEKEAEEFIMNLFNNSKFQKQFYSLFKTLINKFDQKYDVLSGTTGGIILSNKKVPKEILNLVNNRTPSALKKEIKNFIKTEAKKDKFLLPYTKWDFEVKKNNKGATYLYSDKSLPEAQFFDLDPKQEVYISTYNDNLLIAWSTCYEKKCVKRNIFNMINFPN